MSERPYAGLKVLDMSQGIAGPYCAELLAQQGASVIKVEPPAGDWIRVIGGSKDGMSAYAIVNNLGKRSICLDAAQAEGRELILRMAEGADVFVENFRPGVMEKLGLDYPLLAKRAPRLIYLSVTGFGDSGPNCGKPATDSVVQAWSGMAVINKDAAGTPRRMGLLVPDHVTALYATQCVGAALYARERHGRGKHLQLSLAECCAAFQAAPIIDDFLFAGEYKPPITVPAGVFATRDGYVVLATLRDAMWQGLCRAIGREDWIAEPRYATNALRGRASSEINAAVAQILATRDSSEWAARFDEQDVLFSPVQNYSELRADAQMRHMGYFGEIEQTPYGRLPLPYFPGTERARAQPAAPRAGEHSREILAELGMDAAQIERLERAGTVIQAH